MAWTPRTVRYGFESFPAVSYLVISGKVLKLCAAVFLVHKMRGLDGTARCSLCVLGAHSQGPTVVIPRGRSLGVQMVPSSQGWHSFSERPRFRTKWRPLSLRLEEWRGVGGYRRSFQGLSPWVRGDRPEFHAVSCVHLEGMSSLSFTCSFLNKSLLGAANRQALC